MKQSEDKRDAWSRHFVIQKIALKSILIYGAYDLITCKHSAKNMHRMFRKQVIPTMKNELTKNKIIFTKSYFTTTFCKVYLTEQYDNLWEKNPWEQRTAVQTQDTSRDLKNMMTKGLPWWEQTRERWNTSAGAPWMRMQAGPYGVAVESCQPPTAGGTCETPWAAGGGPPRPGSWGCCPQWQTRPRKPKQIVRALERVADRLFPQGTTQKQGKRPDRSFWAFNILCLTSTNHPHSTKNEKNRILKRN